MLVHHTASLTRMNREDPNGILVLAYNRHAAAEIRFRLRALVGDETGGRKLCLEEGRDIGPEEYALISTVAGRSLNDIYLKPRLLAVAAVDEMVRLSQLDPHWNRARAAVISRDWKGLAGLACPAGPGKTPVPSNLRAIPITCQASRPSIRLLWIGKTRATKFTPQCPRP